MVSTEKQPTRGLAHQTCIMATRSDRIAQVVHDGASAALVHRRHEAAARRRLLTHALHSAPAPEELAGTEAVCGNLPLTDWQLEHAVTDRFQRLDTDELEDASTSTIPNDGQVQAGHAVARLSLGDRVAVLREQAAACRAQAIALNAKLALLQAARARLPRQAGELQAARAALIQGSARLDHAVEEIDAVTSVEQQLADSLR